MQNKTINMDEEKRNSIINASINEFAQNGYERASTNNIVKEAGISKGLLFHYFDNKKGLFSFVFDYCVDIIARELMAKLDLSQRDILSRLRDAMLVKMSLSEKYPQIFDFVARVYGEQDEEIKGLVNRKEKETLAESYGKLLQGVDYGLFKPEVDVQRAVKVIMWTLEKYGEDIVDQLPDKSLKDIDYQAVLADIEGYLDLFRNCFYK